MEGFRAPEKRQEEDWLEHVGETTNDQRILDNIVDPSPSIPIRVQAALDARRKLGTITRVFFYKNGLSKDRRKARDIWWRRAYAFEKIMLEDKPVEDIARELQCSDTTVYRYISCMRVVYRYFDYLYIELEERLGKYQHVKRILHFIRIGRDKKEIIRRFQNPKRGSKEEPELSPQEINYTYVLIRKTFIGILQEFFEDLKSNPEKFDNLP